MKKWNVQYIRQKQYRECRLVFPRTAWSKLGEVYVKDRREEWGEEYILGGTYQVYWVIKTRTGERLYTIVHTLRRGWCVPLSIVAGLIIAVQWSDRVGLDVGQLVQRATPRCVGWCNVPCLRCGSRSRWLVAIGECAWCKSFLSEAFGILFPIYDPRPSRGYRTRQQWVV